MGLYRSGSKRAQRIFVAVLALGGLFSGRVLAAGAPAKADPFAGGAPAAATAAPWPTEDLRKEKVNVQNILRAGKAAGAEQKAIIENYYRKYFFPRWTDPAVANQLPNLRKDLRNDFVLARPDQGAGKTGEAHSQLSGIALELLKKMATENQPPVARVNAALMLGELNSAEAGKPGEKPVPSQQAGELLKDFLKSDEMPEAVRVAALVGLQRHADLDAFKNADDRKEMTAIALKILEGGGPKETVTDGGAWMRSQASDLLATLGSPGSQGEVAAALGKVVANGNLPLATRAAAARALGRLNYKGGGAVEMPPLEAAIRRMAYSACRRAKDEAEQMKPFSAVSRRLLNVVTAGQAAATALAAAAKDAAQKQALTTLNEKLAAIAVLFGRGAVEDSAIKQLDTLIPDLAPKTEKAAAPSPAPPPKVGAP